MIRIQQLKLPVTHTQEELEQKIRKTLKIGKHDLQEIELLRRSIDARKKSELKYVYQLDVKVKDENAVLRKAKNNQIVKAEKKPYVFPKSGEQTLVHRPGYYRKRSGRAFLCLCSRKAWLPSARSGARRICRTEKEKCRCVLENRRSEPGIERTVRRGRRRYVFGWKIKHFGERSIRQKP